MLYIQLLEKEEHLVLKSISSHFIQEQSADHASGDNTVLLVGLTNVTTIALCYLSVGAKAESHTPTPCCVTKGHSHYKLQPQIQTE